MTISLGGIVVTSLKKILSLSGGILLATGMNSACFATEANTASSVLSNLLTTTADAIAPNQTQAKPATPPSAESTAGADATALPTFDDPVAGEPVTTATATAPVTPIASTAATNAGAVPATTPQPSSVPQPIVSSATTPVVTQPTTTLATTPTTSVPAVVAKTSEVPATVISGQTTPVQASPEPATSSQPTQLVTEPKKKVGFLSQNGVVLIAPEDMIFPNEMQDGGMYFFSRDIDTLKKKITAGEIALPVQQALTTPAQTIPQTSPVITAPVQQVTTPPSQVTVASPPVSSAPAVAQPQSPAPQNDCQGCHVWLKTTI